MLLFCYSSFAQNKLFMNPIKYTDRLLSVYESGCGSEANIHLLVNGVEIHADTTLFITGKYWAFQIDFGLMKPGDIFKVTDDCGSVPFQQTVKDDYVYVEVPSGPAVSGNGIGPNDQYPPYSKLSTPVSIGKCTPVTIDSHGLVNYNFFCPNTSGVFLVNGSPLTDQPSPINPEGYDINFNGFPGTPVYTINPNGSVTTNTNVKLESNTHYSGQIPIVLEYHHDGGVITGTELSFGFKAMSFRHLGGTGGQLEKAGLGGVINTTSYVGTALSKYKITYDGVYYRAYIDNILIDELHRFVEYGTSSGTLTPGSSAGLDYSTPVTWTGMNSGSQWVSILIDGVLYTRQLFNVAGDILVDGVAFDIACSGGNSGTITVNATGGLPPLQYSINTGAYQSSNIFTGLAAGSYTVHVRDASACTGSNVALVGSTSAVIATIAAKTNASCSGSSTGSVTIQATGGSGTYTYSKDGSGFGTSNVFSGLSAGPYIFYAKDGNGCTTSVKDTIRTTSNIIASIVSQQNVSCSGGNNGGFSVSTAGSLFNGTPQYSRDNGATFQASATFSGLVAGTYQVVVKDNSCSISLTTSVTQPGALDAIATVTKAVSCSGVSDGLITATGSSGVAPYQFSINGTQYSGAAAFTGLAAGNYKIWAKDANGCVKESAIVSVTQPTVVSVSIFNKNDVACYGGNTGSLTLSGSGGTSPYSFSKDGTIFQPSPTFNSLSAGLLPITLKDANGCTATVSGEILQPADISVSASVSNPVSCFGGNNGSIQVTGSGGTGLIKYAIDGNTFTTALTFTGLSANSYVVTAKDNNGCTKSSAPILMTQASQILAVASKTDVKCFAGQDGAVNVTASGGTGAYNYSRDAVNYQTSGVFQELISGSYTFSVKDANSCVRTVDVTVGQPTDLIANSSIQQQVLCYNGNSGIIQASSSGGTTPYQYSLNGTAYQNSSTFNALVIGSYKVWVKDGNGCIKETISNTLTQPTELVGSVASQVAVKCHNGSDGAVLLVSSGGTSPYLYSKDATNFQDTPSFTGLSASTINFVVKDIRTRGVEIFKRIEWNVHSDPL